MSNLAVRILVALVGIPLILLLTMAGGFYFFGLVVVLSAVGLYEFYLLCSNRGATPQAVTGLLFGFCVNAVFYHGKLLTAGHGSSMAELFVLIFLLFLPVVLLVELFRNVGAAALNVATTLFGVCYISLFFGSLIGIRELFTGTTYEWGGSTVVVIFAAIWICDSAAYFVGLGIGRRKIFPRVSPNKTWEGTIAGFIAALLAFVVGKMLALPYMSWVSAIACGIIIGVFGQLGDLVESLIKRDTGVKDSSGLIPGHGGVLDRFDSLLFVSPLMYLYLKFVVL